MSLPRDLLAQATLLATKEPRRPRQASLRRSVSAWTANDTLVYAHSRDNVAILGCILASSTSFPDSADMDLLRGAVRDDHPRQVR